MKCKMVFMLLWGMLLSSLSMGAQQVTNKLYIPEVECGRGKTINVAVALNLFSDKFSFERKFRKYYKFLNESSGKLGGWKQVSFHNDRTYFKYS